MDADTWARFAERTTLHHVPCVWFRMRSYPEQKNLRLRAKSEEDTLIRNRYLPEEAPWLRCAKSACRDEAGSRRLLVIHPARTGEFHP